MKSVCDKNTIEIISLKRPTALDKLAETISKPKGAIPNFGLPRWRVMPLEAKIPMVPGPEGVYNFTRRKVGKKLWISVPDAEFNLSDPYCYEMKFGYDPLHDEHLVPFFSKPHNIQHLVKVGLVTNKLDAKCSLRDYNMYRKYLRKLHCDGIRKELRRKTKWLMEERALQFADQEAQKEAKKLVEREKLMEARKGIIKKRKLAEKHKRREQREKQWKIQKRLETLAMEKRQARELQYAIIKARAESIQEKLKAAMQIKRHKIIRTLLEWRKKESIRKKKRQIRLAQEREQRTKAVEQKWKIRQQFQEEQIKKEQFLLQCIDNRQKQYIKHYNKKIEKETERMEKLLKDVKTFLKCYMARRVPGSREQICCEKYFHSDKGEAQDTVKGLACMYGSHSKSIKHNKDKANRNEIRESKSDKMAWQAKLNSRNNVAAKKGANKKKKKSKQQKMIAQLEENESQGDTTKEIESIQKKVETSDSVSSESTLKEKCRCQIIKTVKQSVAT